MQWLHWLPRWELKQVFKNGSILVVVCVIFLTVLSRNEVKCSQEVPPIQQSVNRVSDDIEKQNAGKDITLNLYVPDEHRNVVILVNIDGPQQQLDNVPIVPSQADLHTYDSSEIHMILTPSLVRALTPISVLEFLTELNKLNYISPSNLSEYTALLSSIGLTNPIEQFHLIVKALASKVPSDPLVLANIFTILSTANVNDPLGAVTGFLKVINLLNPVPAPTLMDLFNFLNPPNVNTGDVTEIEPEQISTGVVSTVNNNSTENYSTKNVTELVFTDKFSTDKTSIDKVSTDKTSTNMVSADKAPTDKVSTDKVVTDMAPTDKVSTDKVLTDNASTDKDPTDKVSTDKVFIDQAPTDKVSTDKALTDKVSTDTERDSTEKLSVSNTSVVTTSQPSLSNSQILNMNPAISLSQLLIPSNSTTVHASPLNIVALNQTEPSNQKDTFNTSNYSFNSDQTFSLTNPLKQPAEEMEVIADSTRTPLPVISIPLTNNNSIS